MTQITEMQRSTKKSNTENHTTYGNIFYDVFIM